MTTNQQLEPTRVGDLMPTDPADRAAALERVLRSGRPLTGAEVDLVLDQDIPTMNVSDAAAVLAAAAAIDNRNVTTIQAQEWAYALAGTSREECLTAVRRARQDNRLDDRGRPEYLTPGVVRDYVLQLRAERAQAGRIRHFRDVIAAWEAGADPRKLPPAEVEAIRQRLAAAAKAGDYAGDPDDRARIDAHSRAEAGYLVAQQMVQTVEDNRREQAERVRGGLSRRLPPPAGQPGSW